MDLNNINLDDIKEKISSLDRKTLIKFGIGFGSIILFLIIYLVILKPIVDNKKISHKALSKLFILLLLNIINLMLHGYM